MGNLQQDETLTVDVSNISDENGIDVGTVKMKSVVC